jgi:hypothetical protein
LKVWKRSGVGGSEESERDAFVGEVAIAVDEAVIDDVVGGGGDREDGGVESGEGS